MNLSGIDLNNLDFNNIGGWPLVIRVIVIVALCIAVAVGGYYIFTQDLLAGLDKVEKEETSLRNDFIKAQGKARNLEAYKQQLAEMRESFGALLRQLPGKTEVAELLVDISQTGLASGLEFELFEPEREVPKEFYAELPIKIKVLGQYHEFGKFVSGVSALPRIVTLHDIKILPVKDSKELAMDVMAKTYRYVEEDDSDGEGQ